MSWDDCEPMQFYSESWHTARKKHRCAECSTAIQIGERYLSCRGKWGDEFEVFKQHEECLAACVAARKWMKDECVPFGELLDWCREWDSSTKREWSKDFRQALAKVYRRRRHNFICGERRSIGDDRRRG